MNYSPILHKIWSDKKFRRLSNNGKLLFFYLFGNESVNWTGIYELDIETCKVKLADNEKEIKEGKKFDFEKTFAEILSAEMIKWDKEIEIIWVINRFKIMLSVAKSDRIIQATIKELKFIEHHFKKEFIIKYKSDLSKGLFLLKDYKDYMPNEETLSEEHIRYLKEIGWGKERIKKHFLNSNYSEQKIDEILTRMLPNLK